MATIIGTPTADFLVGGRDADVIYGADGDDTLLGGSGGDIVLGGGDNDVLLGGALDGAGNVVDDVEVDILDGDSGDDRIFVGSTDVALGGLGSDELVVMDGSAGGYILGDGDLTDEGEIASVYDPASFDIVTYELCSVGAFVNLADQSKNSGAALGHAVLGIEGYILTEHADGFVGDAQARETVMLLDGNDAAHVGAWDLLDAGVGNDTIGLSGNYAEIYGGGSNDQITVVGHVNFIQGDGGFEDSGTGDDVIRNVGGSSRIFGGAGKDKIDHSGTYSDVYGGDGDDQLTVEGDGNFVWGDDEEAGKGNDIIRILSGDGNRVWGGAGNDIAYGGAGNDVAYGEAGNDIAYGGAGKDTLDGGNGADEVSGEDGDDVISGGASNDLLRGGQGRDEFRYWGNDGFMDTIADFNASEDKIGLLDIAGADLVLASKSYDGWSTWLTIGSTKVQLANVKPWELTASNLVEWEIV